MSKTTKSKTTKNKDTINLYPVSTSTPPTRPRATKKSVEQPLVQTKFNASDIAAMLDQSENDSAATMSTKEALKMVIALIPIAEAQCIARPGQSSFYALSALLNQMRELTADLQASTDKSLIIDSITMSILQPAIMQLANFLVENNYSLKKSLSEHVRSDSKKHVQTIIDNNSRSAASYAKMLFENIQQRITEELQK